MKRSLVKLVGFGVLVALPFSACAQIEELSGWVGAHERAFRVRPVAASSVFQIEPAQADFIAITEVFPESATPIPYHYLVTGAGIATFERRYSASGFGPVTYFLRVVRQPAGPVTLTNLGGEGCTPRILGVRAVTNDDLVRMKRDDRFTLMGTVINPRNVISEDEQVKRIAERLATDPQRNIDRSFSCEIYYACRDAGNVRQQLEVARQRSLQYAMPVLLFMDSWWAGTPRNVPDGLGGTFGDLAYQQVCYTPNHVHPEDGQLRKLLGNRYDSHYCLSTPNNWNNTPWLTMNSARLNAYRAQRLREAVDLLEKISGDDTSWIAGIALENEPRYWDTQAAAGVKPHTGERWADFNPCAVAAAARDGVTLNPVDGMSLAELNWLQRNVGRYFQETVDVFRQALAACGLLERFPVYTHSLQLPVLFPGVKINQTAADWALANGARTGLEGMWSQPSDFDRVREWGAWCNLNREETDGLPIDTHLWDLRTAYAMGGGFFNSFNWNLIKEDAYFNYAREFVEGLPSVTLPPVRARRAAADTISFTPPGGLQAFTRTIVPVDVLPGHAARAATVALSIDGGPHRTWFSERITLPADGSCLPTFRFPVPAETKWSEEGSLRLHAYDANGAELRDAATFANDAAQELRLVFDMEQCRILSQLVVQWRQGGETGIQAGVSAEK